MTALKLGRLPDRTPVKISFQATPELAHSLRAYAELYREAYGRAESVSDLVPYMLECFLASDRAFARACRGRRAGAEPGPAESISPGERSHGTDLFPPRSPSPKAD
ncbi:DUF2274 domain-containing protein [Inquilinus limosus]|uniref:DUF2274 domain-containing protein n=1 Tax=Inquilinus limosus TaxID=171674 RepID=UPI003F165A24